VTAAAPQHTASLRAAPAARLLLADRDVRRWLVASRLGSATEPVAPLALALAGYAATGSFGTGAWMSTAFLFAMAAAAPWRGRRLNRRQLPGAFHLPLLGAAAMALLLAAAAARHSQPALLVVLSGGLGLCAAGLEGGYRALLPTYLPPHQLQVAFADEAAFGEATWLVGPFLAGAVALVAPGWAPLLVIACCCAAAALTSRLLRPRLPAPPGAPAGGVLGPLRIRAARHVLLLFGARGVTWGAMVTGGPPLLEWLGGRAALWGAVLAATVASSMAGAFVYAAATRRRPGSQTARTLALFGLWSAGLVGLVVVRSLPAVIAVLCAAGLAYAAISGLLRHRLKEALPPAAQSQGFALEGAAAIAGNAAGAAAVAGLLSTVRPAMAIAGITTTAATIVLFSTGVAILTGRWRRRGQPVADQDAMAATLDDAVRRAPPGMPAAERWPPLDAAIGIRHMSLQPPTSQTEPGRQVT
jgi:MFS family permease